MAEERSLPGWPKKKLVKEVRRHLSYYGFRPVKQAAWQAAWSWANKIAHSYFHVHWPLPSEIGTQYILLLLAEMHDSHCLRLPYQAREILPPGSRGPLARHAAAGLSRRLKSGPRGHEAGENRAPCRKQIPHNRACSKTNDPKAYSMNCETLQEYLDRYGPLVADRARQAFEPLHVPATDAVVTLDLKRPMLPAQAHVVTAAVKTLQAAEGRVPVLRVRHGQDARWVPAPSMPMRTENPTGRSSCARRTWSRPGGPSWSGSSRTARSRSTSWRSGPSCSAGRAGNRPGRPGSSWARPWRRTAPTGGPPP